VVGDLDGDGIAAVGAVPEQDIERLRLVQTYCLVEVMERSQSLRHTEWKARLQLGFSHV